MKVVLALLKDMEDQQQTTADPSEYKKV